MMWEDDDYCSPFGMRRPWRYHKWVDVAAPTIVVLLMLLVH